jgi:hypothetical protein
MKKVWMAAGLAGCLALLPACAGLPVLGSFLGQQVSVAVGDEVPFPDALTLQLAPGAGQGLQAADRVLGLLGGGSMEQRLGDLLKQQTAPLRRQGAQLLRQQLQQMRLFGSVVAQGGNVGLSLGVSRFGLAYDASTGGYQLVMDVQMQLSEPHLGVLWTGKRSAADLSAGVQSRLKGWGPTQLLAQPSAWGQMGALALQDLSAQLLKDLQQHQL